MSNEQAEGLAAPQAAQATLESQENQQTPAVQEETLAVRFTGSGSEYFRIWAVNTLLTVVTLFIYYPFAKVRQLRYFYGNTVVGEHALAFHGKPMAMLRGYALLALLFGLFKLAGLLSPMALGVMVLVIAALAPMLFWSSQRFRLSNTQWRGMRCGFVGSKARAYWPLLVMAIPVVLMFAMAFIAQMPLFEGSDSNSTQEAPAQGAAAAMSLGQGLMFFASMMSWVIVWPVGFWLIKRYQHNNMVWANQRSVFSATVGQSFRLNFAAWGWMMLVMLVAGIAAFALATGLSAVLSKEMAALVIPAIIGLTVYLGALVVGQAYFQARLQNMVWSHTRSPLIRFSSQLRMGPLAYLHLKNWLLVLFTLGLYWPFARVAVARLRLQTVQVHAMPALWNEVAQSGQAQSDAGAGEAAADIFGLDFGL